MTTIDFQFLSDMSTIDKDIILELEENINVFLIINNFTNTFSVIISKDSIKKRKKAIELVRGKLF